MASADVTDNPTTNDEHGFGIANHIHNFNDGFNGIGHLRSEMTGAEVSAGGGHRGPDIVVTAQGSPDSPSQFGPISNAGGKKK